MRTINELREALAHLDAGNEAVNRLYEAEQKVQEQRAEIELLSAPIMPPPSRSEPAPEGDK